MIDGAETTSGVPMKHVDWQNDSRLPANFVPPDDMRVFVDATEDLVIPLVEKAVEENWKSFRALDMSKDQLKKAMIGDWLDRPGQPFLITGKEYKESLEARG